MGVSDRRRLVIAGSIAAAVLVGLAAWVLIPHRWEGPVLFTLTTTHGIHEGDLLGAAAAAVVLGVLALVTVRGGRPAPEGDHG